MTPVKYAQTFGIISLLMISVLIPVLVGRRPSPADPVVPKADQVQLAQQR